MKFLAVIFILSAALGAQAATIAAVSASTADVQTAVDAASDGDTITIPNGSANWTSGITTTKQIIIRALNYTATAGGSASRNVTLTNNSSGPMFAFTSGNSYHCGVGGIAFKDAGGAQNHVQFSGSGTKVPLCFDNWFECQQRNGSASVVCIVDWAAQGGVFWNCIIDSNGYHGDAGSSPYGTDGACFLVTSPKAWTTASTMGTADTGGTNNVYIEDSTFINVGQCPDVDDNGRVVFRYSTNNGAWSVVHAFTSLEGGRHIEYYNNTFSVTYNTTPWRNMGGRYTWIRGGTAVYTANVVNEAVNTSEWGAVRQFDMGDNTTPGTYPQARQVGWGHNGTTNVSDPVYVFSQSGAKAYSYGYVNGWDSIVVTNRDVFINNGSKSGYTTYTYPHPLRSAVEGGGGGGGGTGNTINIGTLRITKP